MNTDARAAILKRIHAADSASTSLSAAQAAWNELPHTIRRNASTPYKHSEPNEQMLQLFTERLHDYDAQVLRATPHDAVQLIARMLVARGVRRLLVPAGFDPLLLPSVPAIAFDEGVLTPLELDTFDGVLTECTVAIAETGSIVLQAVPGQGRRAVSLVPDYHLCVVRVANVVVTVPEAIAHLQPTASLPTTFISGPSATADIEMTRIKGVHGPRFLDVLLLG